MKKLVVLVFLLTTCIHAPDTLKMDVRWDALPIYWSHATTMDPVDALLVEEGFDYWNKTLNRQVFVEVYPDDYFNPHFPAQVTVYSAGENFPAPLGETKTYIRVATTSDDRHTVVLWKEFDELNLNSQRTAIRHEAGHVLGMSHSNDNDCLMYPSVSSDQSRPREACTREIELLRSFYEF